MTDHPGPGQGWYGERGGPAGGPYGGYGPPAAPRPGVVPLRPLGLAEILDGTITTMRRYPRPTFGLSAVVAVITGLLALLQETSVATDLSAPLSATLGASLVSLVAAHATTVLLAGALTLVLSEGILGRPVTLAEVWARLRPRLPGLVGLSLVSGLLVVLGLLAFVIGAVVVAVFLLLAAPAYVLEGTTVTGALRRSVTLVTGSWWRVFGIYALLSLLVAIVSSIVLLPLGVGFAFSAFTGDGGLGTGSYLLLLLATTLLSVVTAPVTSYVVGLLYADQRMRREGLDLQLAQAVGAQPAGGPGQVGSQYGQGQYGQGQDGQGQYGEPQYGQGQYGEPRYGQPGGGQRQPGAGEQPRRDDDWSSPPA